MLTMKTKFAAAAVMVMVGFAAQAAPFASSGVQGSLSYKVSSLAGGAVQDVTWSNDPISREQRNWNGSVSLHSWPQVQVIGAAWIYDNQWNMVETGGNTITTFGPADKVVNEGGVIKDAAASASAVFHGTGTKLYSYSLSNQAGAMMMSGFPMAMGASEVAINRAFTLPAYTKITFTLKAQNTGAMNEYAQKINGLSQYWSSHLMNHIQIAEKQASGGYKVITPWEPENDWLEGEVGDGYVQSNKDVELSFTNNTGQTRQLAVGTITNAYSNTYAQEDVMSGPIGGPTVLGGSNTSKVNSLGKTPTSTKLAHAKQLAEKKLEALRTGKPTTR